MRVRRKDGAFVELSLLRPVWWIAQYGLRIGRRFTLVLSEIEVDVEATVVAIEACPPIAAGDGHVVIGRFKTHQVSNLVEVTLENGTRFTGTDTHPVWLPDYQDWIILKDLQEGERLGTLLEPLTVSRITRPAKISDVYNLEVHGHHVYRITEDGVLVHNTCPGGSNIPNSNYPRDFQSKRTILQGATFKSEGEARQLARQKLGRYPVILGDNKLRSIDGKWQYRAKPVDTTQNHIHLERLDPRTGEVLENWHLYWPKGAER